jgi:hypothetical protein
MVTIHYFHGGSSRDWAHPRQWIFSSVLQERLQGSRVEMENVFVGIK